MPSFGQSESAQWKSMKTSAAVKKPQNFLPPLRDSVCTSISVRACRSHLKSPIAKPEPWLNVSSTLEIQPCRSSTAAARWDFFLGQHSYSVGTRMCAHLVHFWRKCYVDSCGPPPDIFFYPFIFGVRSSDLSPTQIELHKTIDLWISSLRGGFINYDLWNGLKNIVGSKQSCPIAEKSNAPDECLTFFFFLFYFINIPYIKLKESLRTMFEKNSFGWCFRASHGRSRQLPETNPLPRRHPESVAVRGTVDSEQMWCVTSEEANWSMDVFSFSFPDWAAWI